MHSVSPKRISFLAFCGANVLTDTEPLYYMVQGKWPIHRFFHTFVGATFIGAVTLVVGVVLVSLSRRIALPNYFAWQQLRALPIAVGAFLGTYSHIVLDGMTHVDMRPLAPFSQANPMLGWVNYWQVQLICVALGALGALVLYVRRTGSSPGAP